MTDSRSHLFRLRRAPRVPLGPARGHYDGQAASGSSHGAVTRRGLVSLAIALISLSGSVALAPSAAAIPWGSCGTMTAEDKVVRVFPSPQGPLTLRCGGPRWSDEPVRGYRHIKWRHIQDFQGAAAGTQTNWRDVADLAGETIAADPDVVLPARGEQTCRSRVLFLANRQTNQVVRQQIFVMYTQNGSNDVNTLFLRGYQCRPE